MCLQVFIPMIATMKANEESMKKAAQKGFINATDLADYLVKKGLPFRSAYKLSGQLVALCISQNTVLEDLPLTTDETVNGVKMLQKDGSFTDCDFETTADGIVVKTPIYTLIPVILMLETE
jgi:argininosuccinate lyase